jgi:hypothetical protein
MSLYEDEIKPVSPWHESRGKKSNKIKGSVVPLPVSKRDERLQVFGTLQPFCGDDIPVKRNNVRQRYHVLKPERHQSIRFRRLLRIAL